jgi:hypothetical protein
MAENYNQLLDLEESDKQDDSHFRDTNQELEFQNFMLSTAEEDLIAGKIPTSAGNQDDSSLLAKGFNSSDTKKNLGPGLPLPVTMGTPQATPQTALFWNLSYWAHYFQVDTNDVAYRVMYLIDHL